MPEGGRAWLVTRYDDVRAALADPRLAKDWVAHMTPDGFDINADPVRAYLNRHLLNMDPPDHTRLRRLVVKAFTSRRIAGLRPRISEITAGLLDDMASGPDETDLIGSFAFPLPVIVICELVGIPAKDRAEFREWSGTLLSSRGTREQFRAAAVAMYEYFVKLVAAKRRSPGDDLLSALLAAQEAGDSLSEQELLAMLFLLVRPYGLFGEPAVERI